MSRGFSDSLNTYLAGNALVGCLLIKIGTPDSAGGYTQWTDAPFDITWGGEVYQAQGDFLNITETKESADLQIHSINLTISALNTTNIQTFATSGIVNQSVEVRRAFLHPITNLLQGDSAGDSVFLLFKGKVAGYSVANRVNTADITLQVSSQFINFNRINGRRSNVNSFHREHPQDHGMEYSHETLQDIWWGKKV